LPIAYVLAVSVRTGFVLPFLLLTASFAPALFIDAINKRFFWNAVILSFVLINGSPVTMMNWINQVGAVVEPWYGGEQGGIALAEVLFGEVNPGGRLPMTFPKSIGQVPLYYNFAPSGRGYDYNDLDGEPLFPFGYGLSYTKFDYSNLRIEPRVAGADGKVTVRVDVKNSGALKGDEVVQLYLHDEMASVARPLKELKGFARVTLAPSETKTVEFTLTKAQLAMWNRQMKFVVEPGDFKVMVGSSSRDIRLEGGFKVEG
jgi:beta-glucosidase